MTVDIKIIKSSANGNGTQHLFPYGFKIFADGDLDVIIRSSTGTETVKVLDTDYIVTNAGNDTGGNVLFKYNTGNTGDAHYSATDKRPQSGETVILRRGLDITQATDYVANDPFPAESHEDALDRLTLISQELQESIDRSIKISRTNTMTSTEFTVGASDRANKILAFDSSGEIQVTQELGTFQGDWAASTDYETRDIVKDTSTNNIFIVTSAHTSSGSQPLTTNTNSAKYSLIVDAASATTSATNAASSASAAADDAADAEKLAINPEDSQFTLSDGSTTGYSALHHKEKALDAQTASETAKTTSQNYATKIDGPVETSPDTHSAKAWAIGGSGINDTNGAGSAKSWAVEADQVDGDDYSSKTYAISGSTLDGGSAKNWAIGGTDSFDSNQTIGNTGLYSAKYWAEQAAAYKTEFSNIYHGASATDPTEDPDTSALEAGDLYFNTATSKLKYYDGSAWNNIEATDTSSFAGQGFAVAMAIAL